MGSWVIYGLGAETRELPAFVAMITGSGISAGSALWSSGFLPKSCTGVRLRNGKDPVLNLNTPPQFSAAARAQRARARCQNEIPSETRARGWQSPSQLASVR